MNREQVIRALRQLREEQEKRIGELLAALEHDAGKKGERLGEELPEECAR